MTRKAEIIRKTKETNIMILLDLDGTGKFSIETGIPFFNHMLELFSKHSFIDLEIKATGDLQIDAHHTVEDTGIVLGEALSKALGDKKNITRYGYSVLPMDETLALAAIDLSGRPYLSFLEDGKSLTTFSDYIPEEFVKFNPQLVKEFFGAFVNKAEMNLHIKLLAGDNTHHMIEGIFKAFAKALMIAVSSEPRYGIPSTKGRI